jgi:hypothetical protein
VLRHVRDPCVLNAELLPKSNCRVGDCRVGDQPTGIKKSRGIRTLPIFSSLTNFDQRRDER